MLCRVADSLYWIARYIERAENLVRFLKVGWAVSLDTEHSSISQWLSLVDACADRELFEQLDTSSSPASVIKFITREPDNPNSIINCIAAARENARQIREVIPSEVFEEINELHLLLQEEPEFWQLPLTEQLDEIRRRCLVIRGVEEATMQRDESWCFTRMGRMLERADKTARMLDVKYFLLLPKPEDVGGPLDELQWIALLRSVSAYQMYRQYHAEISPSKVSSFLLIEPLFPRSVHYCLLQMITSIETIETDDSSRANSTLLAALKILHEQWSSTNITNLISSGLHEGIDELQQQLDTIHNLTEARYFTPSPCT